ncbi:rod shape-determining protein RodA [Legionella sp. W05-934-2]|jgi:rod shape determining protein RodA|uniref:rod shape-determining protein RodA n=1 Tax=Legionella sp. W05-934-2 TaxID=1198649 RepID=UPI003461B40E
MKNQNIHNPIYRLTKRALHIDFPLLGALLMLMCFGLIILYSASNEDMNVMNRQFIRLCFALLVMIVFAFIPPHRYKLWSPWLYISGLMLLIAVMVLGKIGKGAQRWLELGLFRFQPSEIMKLAVPMMAAWYIDQKGGLHKQSTWIITLAIILVPTLIIAKQPDLGTAIMVASAGLCVIFLAGLSYRIIFSATCLGLSALPILWHFLHDYQKKRVMMLLNPEKDPLGAGYHIIQSKIAIGSGGLAGKGWLQGSQSHLNFLPEHATDFIFAVCGEEFGYFGSFILIAMIICITLRGLQIALQAQTNYTRMLAGSLSFTFFISAFVNIGMVMGILPVVGIPLPLVSYGGTAMVTFMAGFGVLMSISTHKILFHQGH